MAEPDPAPNPAGDAIAAAAAEVERTGKPPLDNAAKKRIGSVAKRMHREGVSIADLQAAAIYLAAHGMSDLQAAHRSHLEALQTTTAAADLAREAAVSRAERVDQPRHAITLAELAEVWSLLQVYWPRVPLPPAEHAEPWLVELRPCPVEFVLQAAQQWSRRTDGQGQWPPTVGQLRTVTRRLFADQLTLEEARRGVALEQAIWRGEAKGDGTDPRNIGL